jgi:hypothetical protein
MRPGAGGGGKRTATERSALRASTPPASMRTMRFSMLWAIAALLALAPKRSTRVCNRSISLAWRCAALARRISSRSRATRYCE